VVVAAALVEVAQVSAAERVWVGPAAAEVAAQALAAEEVSARAEAAPVLGLAQAVGAAQVLLHPAALPASG
jgi:hypothetical protein